MPSPADSGHSGSTRASTRAGSIITLPAHDPEGNQTGTVITKIESILGSVLDDLVKGEVSVSIPYRSRSAIARSRSGSNLLRFPGRTRYEGKKFAAMLRILELSHEALVSGTIVTKRNIYYQNTELFRDQRVVDGLVDDIAFTLGVSRDALNIGLVAGPIFLTMQNGSIIPCGLSHDCGNLIPPTRSIHRIDFGSTRWILVIEKEATFRTLAASEYYNKSLAGQGILITGKGFPDLTTRLFLHTIQTIRPQLPIYGLVDYDPDGIAIMRTYKYGSQGLEHEDSSIVPNLIWLGIRSGDLLHLGDLVTEESSQSACSQNSLTQSSQESLAFSSNGSQTGHGLPRQKPGQRGSGGGLLPLTSRDRRVAVNILKSVCNDESLSIDDMEQQRELQLMLLLNIKAEIQAVDHYGNIADWLDQRLGISQIAE
ncbi:Spo11/DNA topoisomerase VI subunit A [Phialemonium atrogriseum]|uniref:DNA topoisomerase (ATP-hydrolyzing) n=1 Tax=Phialemonium atrogriseum TaxID=1093897 RepID=A0AAJ0BXL3_9PEZI|nr:Spo11/DNA topoisomerase VI subunit A [Phialemonium atrogriseum]KAK1766355.1 Spo11/DNA topoisomerase VI subunit A [Phialemonium atrogriseum]